MPIVVKADRGIRCRRHLMPIVVKADRGIRCRRHFNDDSGSRR